MTAFKLGNVRATEPRNDNTIIYYGQRAEAEIQNGALFLRTTVHSRRLTWRGEGLSSYIGLHANAAIGARLGCSAIIPFKAMEALSAFEPRRPLLPAHTDEGGDDTFVC